MAYPQFPDFFQVATGFRPYPYQETLATCSDLPQVLSVPTGAGKTAAVVLSWLYRRRFSIDGIGVNAPRRLVYCLPMRALVEQTRGNAHKWLNALAKRFDMFEENPVKVYTIMGGDADDNWCLEPDKEAIVIGTQDMLLSRALNRGYSMSRFRWPQAFGLLNTDCLWIFDEIQLMGVGLATSAQLQAFRDRLGTYRTVHSLWMSATACPQWLDTVDHPTPESVLMLGQEECRGSPSLERRMNASKSLRQLISKSKKATTPMKPREIASEIIKRHTPGTLSLIIVNTVARAQDVYVQVKKELTRKPSKHKVCVTKASDRLETVPRSGGSSLPAMMQCHYMFRSKARQSLNAMTCF